MNVLFQRLRLVIAFLLVVMFLHLGAIALAAENSGTFTVSLPTTAQIPDIINFSGQANIPEGVTQVIIGIYKNNANATKMQKIPVDSFNTPQNLIYFSRYSIDSSKVITGPGIYHVVIQLKLENGNILTSNTMTINLQGKNSSEEVLKVLHDLSQTYRLGQVREFMNYISKDFEGDRYFLEVAIRKDFMAYQLNTLDLNVVNIATNWRNNEVEAKIRFQRSVNPRKNPSTVFNDSGVTSYVFKREEGELKIVSMAKPLLFGLSYADEIATETVYLPENKNNLAVSHAGDVIIIPKNVTGTFSAVENAIVDQYGWTRWGRGTFSLGIGLANGVISICPGNMPSTIYISNSKISPGMPVPILSLIPYNGGLLHGNIAAIQPSDLPSPTTLAYYNTTRPLTTNDILAIYIPQVRTYLVAQLVSSNNTHAYFAYKYLTMQ